MFTSLITTALLGALTASVSANPTSHFITKPDGVSIHYSEYGDPSNPSILFVHGHPMSAETWDEYLYYFSRLNYHAVAYDRRGFGQSSDVDWGFDFDTLTSDLSFLVDSLNMDNFTLVGHSMGTGEVIKYTSGPDAHKVNKAVLLGTFAPAVTQQPDHPYGPTMDEFKAVTAALTDDVSGWLLNTAIGFFNIEPNNATSYAQQQGRVFDFWRQGSNALYTAVMEAIVAIGTTDLTQDLKAISVPTLLIHGTADNVVNYNTTGKMAAELIPDSQLTTYEGWGHALYLQHKDVVWKDILDFMSQK